MPKAQKVSEQINSLQEQYNEEVRVLNGGRIRGSEGGLRSDMFGHDVNSEYDFSEDDAQCVNCLSTPKMKLSTI